MPCAHSCWALPACCCDPITPYHLLLPNVADWQAVRQCPMPRVSAPLWQQPASRVVLHEGAIERLKHQQLLPPGPTLQRIS